MTIMQFHKKSRRQCRSRKYERLRAVVNAALRVVLIAAMTVFATPLLAGPQQTVLMIGDSLTAGLGLAREKSIPVRLQTALKEAGLTARVINAGVSGDTSAGGRSRLGWGLSENPDVVVIELGANDGLRGLDPRTTRENLDAMIVEARQAGARVLLTGMIAPPNLGSEYGDDFNRVFPDLAARHAVAFFPFFLEGVAAVPDLNQDDGIHPNEKGAEIIVRNLLPYVSRLLKEAE